MFAPEPRQRSPGAKHTHRDGRVASPGARTSPSPHHGTTVRQASQRLESPARSTNSYALAHAMGRARTPPPSALGSIGATTPTAATRARGASRSPGPSAAPSGAATSAQRNPKAGRGSPGRQDSLSTHAKGRPDQGGSYARSPSSLRAVAHVHAQDATSLAPHHLRGGVADPAPGVDAAMQAALDALALLDGAAPRSHPHTPTRAAAIDTFPASPAQPSSGRGSYAGGAAVAARATSATASQPHRSPASPLAAASYHHLVSGSPPENVSHRMRPQWAGSAEEEEGRLAPPAWAVYPPASPPAGRSLAGLTVPAASAAAGAGLAAPSLPSPVGATVRNVRSLLREPTTPRAVTELALGLQGGSAGAGRLTRFASTGRGAAAAGGWMHRHATPAAGDLGGAAAEQQGVEERALAASLHRQLQGRAPGFAARAGARARAASVSASPAPAATAHQPRAYGAGGDAKRRVPALFMDLPTGPFFTTSTTSAAAATGTLSQAFAPSLRAHAHAAAVAALEGNPSGAAVHSSTAEQVESAAAAAAALLKGISLPPPLPQPASAAAAPSQGAVAPAQGASALPTTSLTSPAPVAAPTPNDPIASSPRKPQPQSAVAAAAAAAGKHQAAKKKNAAAAATTASSKKRGKARRGHAWWAACWACAAEDAAAPASPTGATTTTPQGEAITAAAAEPPPASTAATAAALRKPSDAADRFRDLANINSPRHPAPSLLAPTTTTSTAAAAVPPPAAPACPMEAIEQHMRGAVAILGATIPTTAAAAASSSAGGPQSPGRLDLDDPPHDSGSTGEEGDDEEERGRASAAARSAPARRPGLPAVEQLLTMPLDDVLRSLQDVLLQPGGARATAAAAAAAPPPSFPPPGMEPARFGLGSGGGGGLLSSALSGVGGGRPLLLGAVHVMPPLSEESSMMLQQQASGTTVLGGAGTHARPTGEPAAPPYPRLTGEGSAPPPLAATPRQSHTAAGVAPLLGAFPTAPSTPQDASRGVCGRRPPHLAHQAHHAASTPPRRALAAASVALHVTAEGGVAKRRARSASSTPAKPPPPTASALTPPRPPHPTPPHHLPAAPPPNARSLHASPARCASPRHHHSTLRELIGGGAATASPNSYAAAAAAARDAGAQGHGSPRSCTGRRSRDAASTCSGAAPTVGGASSSAAGVGSKPFKLPTWLVNSPRLLAYLPPWERTPGAGPQGWTASTGSASAAAAGTGGEWARPPAALSVGGEGRAGGSPGKGTAGYWHPAGSPNPRGTYYDLHAESKRAEACSAALLRSSVGSTSSANVGSGAAGHVVFSVPVAAAAAGLASSTPVPLHPSSYSLAPAPAGRCHSPRGTSQLLAPRGAADGGRVHARGAAAAAAASGAGRPAAAAPAVSSYAAPLPGAPPPRSGGGGGSGVGDHPTSVAELVQEALGMVSLLHEPPIHTEAGAQREPEEGRGVEDETEAATEEEEQDGFAARPEGPATTIITLSRLLDMALGQAQLLAEDVAQQQQQEQEQQQEQQQQEQRQEDQREAAAAPEEPPSEDAALATSEAPLARDDADAQPDAHKTATTTTGGGARRRTVEVFASSASDDLAAALRVAQRSAPPPPPAAGADPAAAPAAPAPRSSSGGLLVRQGSKVSSWLRGHLRPGPSSAAADADAGAGRLTVSSEFAAAPVAPAERASAPGGGGDDAGGGMLGSLRRLMSRKRTSGGSSGGGGLPRPTDVREPPPAAAPEAPQGAAAAPALAGAGASAVADPSRVAVSASVTLVMPPHDVLACRHEQHAVTCAAADRGSFVSSSASSTAAQPATPAGKAPPGAAAAPLPSPARGGLQARSRPATPPAVAAPASPLRATSRTTSSSHLLMAALDPLATGLPIDWSSATLSRYEATLQNVQSILNQDEAGGGEAGCKPHGGVAVSLSPRAAQRLHAALS